MSDELHKQNIEALLYERSGYETRLAQAEDDATKEEQKANIAAVNVQLNRLGYKLDATAKAAEKKTTVKTTSKKAPARKAAKR